MQPEDFRGQCMPRFELDEILTRDRQWQPDWLILQAECLSCFAKERNSPSALVYAALETRNAIEQLIFTIISLCRGTVDDQTLAECRGADGLGRVLRRTQPDYRKMIRFAKICPLVRPPENAQALSERHRPLCRSDGAWK